MNSQFDYLKAIIKPTKTKKKRRWKKKYEAAEEMCIAIFMCDAEIFFLGTRHDLTLNLLNYSFDRRDRFPLRNKKFVIRTKNTDLWFRRYHHFLQACDYLHHRFFKWVNRPRDCAQTSWHVLQMSLMKRKQKSENLFLAITASHLLKPRSSAIADRPW